MGNARLGREWGHSMTNRCATPQSTEVVRRWAPPAIVTLAATAALTALTAASPAALAGRACAPPRGPRPPPAPPRAAPGGGAPASRGGADHGDRIDQEP